jgi:hypothetical protein
LTVYISYFLTFPFNCIVPAQAFSEKNQSRNFRHRLQLLRFSNFAIRSCIGILLKQRVQLLTFNL